MPGPFRMGRLIGGARHRRAPLRGQTAMPGTEDYRDTWFTARAAFTRPWPVKRLMASGFGAVTVPV